jgi:hypothetical protein
MMKVLTVKIYDMNIIKDFLPFSPTQKLISLNNKLQKKLHACSEKGRWETPPQVLFNTEAY